MESPDGHAKFVTATGSLDDTIASHASALSELAATISAPSKFAGNGLGTRAERVAPPDEALESHEVIELQAFSHRKEWIVEKIKFLESLPPVEVFIGLDALRAPPTTTTTPPTISDDIPSREQLQEWMKEHDRIEKETEIFDSGELRKLKKLTKDAAHRHLSREDTDLIEIALTTIFELDKLFHLLRDRSENLELLSVRLTWEERRTAAWQELATVVSDLRTFVSTRARWSPASYDDLPAVPDTVSSPVHETTFRFVERRASITSLSSTGTDAARLNRASRFKHLEQLTKDAANISSRITGLRHGNIHAAGKALDKLIDSSRREVPEEILDEQDRLEAKGVTELENTNKFVMAMVTQWKKADEFYVETLKDQTAAKALLDDIEMARMTHPTTRQNTSFNTRTATLLKRITTRGDPTLTLPRPKHAFFPDQPTNTEQLVQSLVEERAATLEIATAAKRMADEYAEALGAVKRVDKLVKSAGELGEELDALVMQLETGVTATDGDGSSPDLMTAKCLDKDQHSAFLALMPTVLQKIDDAHSRIDILLLQAPTAMLQVSSSEIDPEFREKAASAFRELTTRKERSTSARESLASRVALLREARKVWSAIQDGVTVLESMRREISDGMERDRWVSQNAIDGIPPTPESQRSLALVSPSPSIISTSFDERITSTRTSFATEIDAPLADIAQKVPTQLHAHLTKSAGGLHSLLESLVQMHAVWEGVKAQTAAMSAVRDQAYDLQLRAEDVRQRLEAVFQQVIAGEEADVSEAMAALDKEMAELRQAVTAFTEGLSSRVPFVAAEKAEVVPTTRPEKRRTQSMELRADMLLEQPAVQMPFNLTALDGAVRTDCNRFAMLLAGDIVSVKRKRQHIDIAFQARVIDGVVKDALDSIMLAAKDLESLQASISPQEGITLVEHLAALNTRAKETHEVHRTSLDVTFSQLRELLKTIETSPGSHDAEVYDPLVVARREAVDAALARFERWSENIAAAQRNIQEHYSEEMRLAEERCLLEKARLEEEERAQLEATRLEEERLEQERLKKERTEQERVEQERLEQERREQERLERERLEQERLERERVEQERLERERLEEERLERERLEKERDEQLRRELERQEKERAERERLEQARLEQERQDRERAERKRLEQERLESERLAEERLDQERQERERLQQAHLEKDRLAQELLDQERLERERLLQELQQERLMRGHLERRLTEKERLEQERAEQKRLDEERLEQERVEKERIEHVLEQERLEQERLERQRLEQERVEKERLERERLEQERLEQLRAEEEVERKRLEQEAKKRPQAFPSLDDDEDIFGFRVTSGSPTKLTPELSALQAKTQFLRRQLRSLGLHNIARPSQATAPLPDEELHKHLESTVAGIATEAATLPSKIDLPIIHTEVQSLLAELDAAHQMLARVRGLALLSKTVQDCDALSSDLLEHIDSYPSPPMGELSSSFVTSVQLPPEEQMESRLAHTRNAIQEFTANAELCKGDPRVSAEQERIMQTWAELEDMAMDRLHGTRSRPGSSFSTGRDSRTSSMSHHSSNSMEPLHEEPATPVPNKKKKSYAHLGSGAAPRRGGLLAPQPETTPTDRRAASGASDSRKRASSRLSMSSTTTRSVSGPTIAAPFSSRVQAPTFASRQRTSSITSNNGTPTPVRDDSTPLRKRAQTNQAARADPSSDVARARANSVLNNTRNSMPRARNGSATAGHSTWSRAPRVSFPSIPASGSDAKTPQSRPAPSKATGPKLIPPKPSLSGKRKPYVANPKNKLDMAVGEVVNNLPVHVNIEAAEPFWKDQSGKYWIGTEEPKLCFCRILRSQMVMVRVGGGWQSLEKFIQFHFADLFRILPDSPPRHNSIRNQQEKWINSSTLLEQSTTPGTPPRAPRTPEPSNSPRLPSFALSTPPGKTPLKPVSPPGSGGSPLSAMQFIRRAEKGDHATGRPSTPTKSSTLRSRPAVLGSSALSSSALGASALGSSTIRAPAWRP